MCHSTILFAILAGLLIGRILMRLRWRFHGYGGGGCGGGGGGCGGGGGHWRRGGRWGRDGGGGWGHHHGWHRDGGHDAPMGGGGGWDSGVRLAQVVRDLELNQRQREETVEVFAAIRDALGASRFAEWRELDGALESTAAEAFDKVGVEISLTGLGAIPEPARKTVVDGLEHLHNILTPEQRDRLRSITRNRAAA